MSIRKHHKVVRVRHAFPKQSQPRSSAAWTKTDDEKLIDCRRQGEKWETIAKEHFAPKSANACRKRHERLLEMEACVDAADKIKHEDLGVAYKKHREVFWQAIASDLGNDKWEACEAMVSTHTNYLFDLYLTIISIRLSNGDSQL
jgi:hypothetical protein